MFYVFILAGAFALLILLLNVRSKARKRKTIQALEFQWGRPKDEYFNFDMIERYRPGVLDTRFHRLSDQTIIDLDFHRLFYFSRPDNEQDWAAIPVLETQAPRQFYPCPSYTESVR